MYTRQIDIDERLAELWSLVYGAVVELADRHFGRGREFLLPQGCGLVEAVLVTRDGVVRLRCCDGSVDDAEQFGDDVFYAVYRSLRQACGCADFE